MDWLQRSLKLAETVVLKHGDSGPFCKDFVEVCLHDNFSDYAGSVSPS
ncbi:hypothetical protein MCEMSE15_00886 [Fimbriimonadaceae bacterium]